MLNHCKMLLLFGTIIVGMSAQAEKKVTLEEVALKYKKAKLVEMKVEKTVKSELLGRETIYSGFIYMAKGRFRWENTTPEKSLLVFDGNTIWSEQTPPAEFGGPLQVAKGIVDKRTKAQVLISSLMGEGLDQNFKISEQKTDGTTVKLLISPIKNGLTIKEIQLLVGPSDSIIYEISYKDEIGNQTIMRFSSLKFLNKEKPELFKYHPPKGAQVTEL